MTWDVAPEIAARQDGVFTAAQALAAGWTAGQVRRRRATGRWVTVAGRGLALRDAPMTPRALGWAAQLTWPAATVCRSTAAGIHGFPVPDSGTAEVLVGAGHRPMVRIRPHTASLGTGDGVILGGLHVTDRLGTALDCLAFFPFGDALDLLAWLTSRAELRRETLEIRARAARRRPGSGQLQRLLTITRSGAVSAAEYRLHGLMRGAGLTGWEACARVSGSSGGTAVVDVLFRAQRVVIEVDGERAHSGHRAFVHDRRRQNDLITAGYLVLRFTWWDITERPGTVLTQIRSALASR